MLKSFRVSNIHLVVKKNSIATLPNGASLYDTVTLLAKLSMSLHDVVIVLTNLQSLQFGFGFWQPKMTFKASDTLNTSKLDPLSYDPSLMPSALVNGC